MQLIDVLRQHAAQYADKPAICDHGQVVTYGQLLPQVEAEAGRLLSLGVGPGKCYPLVLASDAASVVTLLALHVVGAVSVPVEAARQSENSSAPVIPAGTVVDASVSDVLFTTGTTSQPKAVLLTWDAVLADAENLIAAHQYSPDVTFVICSPLQHFGAWSKLWPTLLVGGTLCLLDGLKDTEALFAALGAYRRTATFLVPSAIRMLMQLGSEQLRSLAHHIDFIETGAAPMAAIDMEQLRRLLPRTRLYNTYASTETGVVCTYPYHGHEAEHGQPDEPALEGCVGPAMRHAQVRLDAEGHVVVSGRMIMAGYWGQEPVGHEVITSDIGRFDDRQRLYIVGRDSDFINVGGLKVSPSEVEAAAMQLSGVADCICIPHPHPLMGQVPELLVVSHPGQYDRRALIAHLRQRLEAYKVPLLYRQVESIRHTFNGKPDRKSYLTQPLG